MIDYNSRSSEGFPADWKDPLELYGTWLQELVGSGHDLELERKNVKALIDKYGDRWVWENRRRIVQMVRSLKDSVGEVG
jgi:hypothetical protein